MPPPSVAVGRFQALSCPALKQFVSVAMARPLAAAVACQSVLVGFLSVSMAPGWWRAVSPLCLLPPCLPQVHCKRARCNIGRTLPVAALSSAKIRQSCLPCNIPGCKNLCKRLHSAVPPRVLRGSRLFGGACLHICLWCRPLPGVAPSACEKGRLGWPYGPFCGLAGAVLQGAAVGPGHPINIGCLSVQGVRELGNSGIIQ